jgi:hypothetical protein
MPKFRLVNGATQFALCMLLPLGSAAFGQTQAQPVAAGQHAPAQLGLAQSPVGQSEETSAATKEQAEEFPVLAVTGVEVLPSKLKSGPVVIAVSGLTSSEGWTDVELVPLTSGTPSDHVLNLVLVGQPPPDAAPPTGYAPVYAILPLASDHPFKAIRVRGASNSVLLKDLPGLVEATAPVDPCTKCIGQYFVAKGDTAPAGVPADQLLRQESLPPTARVIRPNDGIGDVQRNPDRLTLVVGDDGRVVDAVWE